MSNIPPNLANPDSLFYAFEKFGSVARVKILHNKRNTALIQVNLRPYGELIFTWLAQITCSGTANYLYGLFRDQ